MNYFYHLLTMIMLYAILGVSLNLLIGYGGLLALCQGAFYGVGAYTCAVLIKLAGFSFCSAAFCAILVAALVSFFVAGASLRFRGDIFILATLGFQMILFSILYNWVSLTRGPYGIPGIPRPMFFGIKLSSLTSFLALATCSAAVIIFIHWQLVRSPYGRALRAVRDDELAARAIGKNPIYFRTTAFVLAGCSAALAGTLFATYISFIDPTSFGIDESIFIVTVVVIGGAGSLYGPILGAIFAVLLPEALRFLQVPGTIAPNVRQVLFGLLLILAMRFRPNGLVGKYTFD